MCASLKRLKIEVPPRSLKSVCASGRLAVFLRDTFDERGLTPIPLVSTDHDVVIAAGLAVVTTHRLFKNVEPQSIEAVLTFPLPVLATLFELTAEVEGRRLQAKAQVRAEARRTYEDAIDRGKSAVLHEELLRGVHMISVANIQTGSEIRVTTKWALPLSVVGDHATLRIGFTFQYLSVPQILAVSPSVPTARHRAINICAAYNMR